MTLEASSKKQAIILCKEQMGETPDVVYEMEGTLIEIELRRENQRLKSKLLDLIDRLDELRDQVKSLIED